MEHTRQIARLLHDEHLSTVAALERFEALLHAQLRASPGALADDPGAAATLGEIEALIASDVRAHFAFEEDSLFPLLADFGDAEIGELLAEEHRSILDVAGPLAELCRAAREGAADDAKADALRRLGAEFVELMIGHIQKEEMGLLMALDVMLDEARDSELVMAYSAAR